MSVDWNSKLISATRYANLQYLEEAFNNGGDVNTEDKVSRGANINRICYADWEKGNTILAICINRKLSEDAKYLISVGANVCIVGKEGKPPLSWAVRNKDIEMIELLLDHGAHFTIPTAFLEAIELNNLEIVKILISKGANVNVLYKNGHTPLTKALEIVDGIEIVKELIANGADVNIADLKGNHPLIKAIKSGRFEIARLLVEKGANPDLPDTENNFPLIKATELGNLELVKTLIEKGATLKVTDKLGRTPFITALQENHFQIVKYFVERVEDINLALDSKETPLSIAASNCNYQMFQFLFDSGADINLACEKIEEVANENEDFAIFVKTIKGKNKIKDIEVEGSNEESLALN